jgi:hypothetical protein
MVLRRPTQRTQARVKAFLMDGRRADSPDAGAVVEPYTCTTPRASNRITFAPKSSAVRSLRRHGRLKLRLRMRMVNALGRSTTLRRTVTLRPDPAAALRDPERALATSRA